MVFVAQQLTTSEGLLHALGVNLDLVTEDEALTRRRLSGWGDEHLPADGEALDTCRQVDRPPHDPVLRALRRADVAHHHLSGV